MITSAGLLIEKDTMYPGNSCLPHVEPTPCHLCVQFVLAKTLQDHPDMLDVLDVLLFVLGVKEDVVEIHHANSIH